MNVGPVYKDIEQFLGNFQWYNMQSKYIVSTMCFKFKNENNELVTFNGQSITVRLSIK